jgi:hypothetical protein
MDSITIKFLNEHLINIGGNTHPEDYEMYYCVNIPKKNNNKKHKTICMETARKLTKEELGFPLPEEIKYVAIGNITLFVEKINNNNVYGLLNAYYKLFNMKIPTKWDKIKKYTTEKTKREFENEFKKQINTFFNNNYKKILIEKFYRGELKVKDLYPNYVIEFPQDKTKIKNIGTKKGILITSYGT